MPNVEGPTAQATQADRLILMSNSRGDAMLGSLLAVTATLTLCSTGAMASQGATGQSPVGGGLLVGLAIAYLSRRRQIGGWLLYFYMQLFGSLLVTGLLLPTTLAQFAPAVWESSSLYVWYILSTGPVLLALLAEAGVATYLLFRRTEAVVVVLKGILASLVIASAAAIAIDLVHFNEGVTLFFDALTLVFSAIWLAYFHCSTRVRRVFIEHNWNYAAQESSKVPPTAAERRYLRKRAALVAGITFVAFLAMMGSALGDKKPDAGIFFVPLFYAALAAALGRYLPIRKKKRESLAATGAPSRLPPVPDDRPLGQTRP